MKYCRKVFHMNDAELQCVTQNLNLVLNNNSSNNKSDLQESIVRWLVSQGLDISHDFLFFEDEQNESFNNNLNDNFSTKLRRRSIYLLKRNKKCECCPRAESSMFQLTKVSPMQVTDSNNSKNVNNLKPNLISSTSSTKLSGEIMRYNKEPKSVDSNLLKSKVNNHSKVELNKKKSAPITSQPFPTSKQYDNFRTTKPKNNLKNEDVIVWDCCKSYCIECGRFWVSILRL